MRLPTYQELRRFCAVDGWQDRDAARGAKTGDHFRYVKVLRDGTLLYTRVSHGRGSLRTTGLFRHILQVELRVTAEQFWEAVDKGVAPVRPGEVVPAAARPTLPYDLVRNLTDRAGMPLTDVLNMAKDEAVAAWQEWLAERGGEGGP
jgi:hypothetical protein